MPSIDNETRIWHSVKAVSDFLYQGLSKLLVPWEAV
jgi:hypothetical protein